MQQKFRWTRRCALLGGVLAGGLFMTVANAAPPKAAKAPVAPVRRQGSTGPLHLMILDPGHFHASLVQKESYPNILPRVDVYAPLGTDLTEYMKRVMRFNTRKDAPTAWNLEIHTGPDFFDRLKKEKPGNVVVISGRNRGKIDYINGAVGVGVNALVDKPWILRAEDLPRVKETLDLAERKGVVALDLMTERHEVTTQLQKELVNTPDVFGKAEPGTPDEPGVYMESVHNLLKVVAGAPNLRPAWFFDTAQQGEGLNDVGTHLVDLVPWTLFPDQAIDHQKDVDVVAAQRWPTLVPKASFQRVTGESDFPEFLLPAVKGGTLEYFCNTLVTYKLRGVHVKLNVIWDWEAPAGGGDTHFAYYRGTRARIEIRQGAADKYKPELYVIPARPEDMPAIVASLRTKLAALEAKYPGVGIEEGKKDVRLSIPDALRVGHEAHFAQVAKRFFDYVANPKSVPAWEKANMLAKYYVTTKGVELARQVPVREPPRLAK